MRTDFPNSSNIDYAEYDEMDNSLIIKFKSGGIYKYVKVPKVVYTRMTTAESAGQYFHKHIKGAYDYKRIA